MVLSYSLFQHKSVYRCIYTKFLNQYGVINCLYVDDMLAFNIGKKGIDETKKYLSSQFKMKDLGEVDTILAIKVHKHSMGFALS